MTKTGGSFHDGLLSCYMLNKQKCTFWFHIQTQLINPVHRTVTQLKDSSQFESKADPTIRLTNVTWLESSSEPRTHGQYE